MISDTLRQCANEGAREVIPFTAPFKDIEDSFGGQLHHEIAQLANEGATTVIGTDTFCLISLPAGLDACFTTAKTLVSCRFDQAKRCGGSGKRSGSSRSEL